MSKFHPIGAALLAVAVLTHLPAAHAQQQGPGWFIPSQQQPRAAAPARPAPRAAPRPPAMAPAIAPGSIGEAPAPQDQAVEQAPVQIPSPPIPTLPALAKTAAPPAAVVGVLGVPEVMRASSAAQEVERVIGTRREKLAQDAQKEQATWRDIQQSVAGQRTTLGQDQLRTREHELQDRITKAQREFRDRNRIIQEAAQYSLGQIESTLIAVIRQVAESRSMNLVLHRSQVALNINEFDITDQVAAQLNKVLPNVEIPPDGADPVELAKKRAAAAAAATAQASGAPVMQMTPSNGPSAVLPTAAPGGQPAGTPPNGAAAPASR